MCITEEKINKNYLLWTEYLKKYDCYSEELIDDYGDAIRIGAFAMSDSSGASYQGSLLNVVLNNLCVIATHINEGGFGINGNGKEKHPYLYVDKKSLMKVLLLQHISKAEMFVPSKEQWKINKGMLYEFNSEIATSLKLGERSIFLCMKYGIKLTEEEYDAMKVCDKDEEKNNSFVTPLAEIVKIANQLTAIETYQKYKQTNGK
jgi:hypothetical protein